jgi:hypothetical protein
MIFKRCCTNFSPKEHNFEVELVFNTDQRSLREVYNKLPFDTSATLNFKNIIGNILGIPYIDEIEIDYKIDLKNAEKDCNNKSSVLESGVRNIMIIGGNNDISARSNRRRKSRRFCK